MRVWLDGEKGGVVSTGKLLHATRLGVASHPGSSAAAERMIRRPWKFQKSAIDHPYIASSQHPQRYVMYARHVQKLIATATSLRSRAHQLRKRTSYSNAGLPFANASDEKFVPWKYEAWRAPPKEIRETKEARHRPKNRRGIDNVLKSADPLKIAHTIKNMLFKDDFDEAMEVVRRASSQLPEQCIVSWNHIIDWQMSKHRISDAVKTYNEVYKTFGTRGRCSSSDK